MLEAVAARLKIRAPWKILVGSARFSKYMPLKQRRAGSTPPGAAAGAALLMMERRETVLSEEGKDDIAYGGVMPDI